MVFEYVDSAALEEMGETGEGQRTNRISRGLEHRPTRRDWRAG